MRIQTSTPFQLREAIRPVNLVLRGDPTASSTTNCARTPLPVPTFVGDACDGRCNATQGSLTQNYLPDYLAGQSYFEDSTYCSWRWAYNDGTDEWYIEVWYEKTRDDWIAWAGFWYADRYVSWQTQYMPGFIAGTVNVNAQGRLGGYLDVKLAAWTVDVKPVDPLRIQFSPFFLP